MSEREWKLFIEDVLESIELIEKYVKGMEFDDFTKDRKTIDAVIRNFTIIGEASKNIPDNIKNKYLNTDWKGMAGFRNIIVHAYFEISNRILWHIIKNELPPLKEQMRQILEDETGYNQEFEI